MLLIGSATVLRDREEDSLRTRVKNHQCARRHAGLSEINNLITRETANVPNVHLSLSHDVRCKSQTGEILFPSSSHKGCPFGTIPLRPKLKNQKRKLLKISSLENSREYENTKLPIRESREYRYSFKF